MTIRGIEMTDGPSTRTGVARWPNVSVTSFESGDVIAVQTIEIVDVRIEPDDT
jgi:hypothetical protein